MSEILAIGFNIREIFGMRKRTECNSYRVFYLIGYCTLGPKKYVLFALTSICRIFILSTLQVLS